MVRVKQVKSVLNKHKKRDSWFLDDYSVNPYKQLVGRDPKASKRFYKFILPRINVDHSSPHSSFHLQVPCPNIFLSIHVLDRSQVLKV